MESMELVRVMFLPLVTWSAAFGVLFLCIEVKGQNGGCAWTEPFDWTPVLLFNIKALNLSTCSIALISIYPRAHSLTDYHVLPQLGAPSPSEPASKC